ncbi:MAG: hypothetical protein K6T91_02270 [Firmicutes bacterium]|nr:hypothetical protein [Bacillota bacterium]
MQKAISHVMSTKGLLARVIIMAILVSMLTPSFVFAIILQSDWATLSTQHFLIYAPKRADIEQIGDVAERIYTEMASRYKYNQSQIINLYIYTDQAAFLSGSPSPDAAGYASPCQNMIAVLLGAGNSTTTLRHEISHMMFLRSVPKVNTVPIWFIEGLAIYESKPGIEAAEIAKYALARDIPDLVGNENQSLDNNATKQDYAQGYMVIDFIVNEFGEPKLYEVIEKLQKGLDFNDALTQVLGLSQDNLNAKWKGFASGEVKSIWLMQLRDIGWYLLSSLVILTAIIVPFRKRKRLREMEDEDYL